jgi:hypothetical protein
MAEKASFVGASVTTHLRPTILEWSTDMAAFTNPFAWFVATLRSWWVRERQVVADEAADEAMMAADVRHEQNILLWYLPPPC